MPELDALRAEIGDGFSLVATDVRRGKSGAITADLALNNGRILFVDRCVLNSVGVREWAEKASGPVCPPTDRMAEAVLQRILPDAQAMLQEGPRRPPTQADQLVGLVLEADDDLAADVAAEVELFHTPDYEAYGTLTVGGHQETHRLRSAMFRQWMARRYFQANQKTPNTQALIDATNVLAGRAIFEGPERRVHTRIADVAGTVYLDLANERWQAVAIDATGWRVVDHPPVKFRRSKGMLPLPTPTRGGDLDLLRGLVNIPDNDEDETWRLVVGWLVGAFRPRGPYAVLVVHGEHGSAKSTLVRLLRGLIDPNEAAIRATPREERDLVIAASNGWALCFDNVSHLPDWLSDAYCRLATGSGFGTRKLYEDDEEAIFNAQRPIALNGIDEIATRPDLIDRSVIVRLPTIPEDRRQEEGDLLAAFDAARPAILAEVLDAVAAALLHEATTKLVRKPRMADFGRWVTAAEGALGWKPGSFLAAYFANRRESNDLVLDGSVVSQAVREWAATLAAPWEGTATDLLKVLDGRAGDKTKKLKAWPDSGRALSNALRRLAPNLRAIGTEITFDIRKHGGRRCIRIERVGDPSSPSSPDGGSGPRDGANRGDGGGDDGDDQATAAASIVTAPSPEDAYDDGQGDDGDGGDDESPLRSDQGWFDWNDPDKGAGGDRWTR